MFYLFILESIGTSELLLIGLVALIILGPRKLPQVARTIGKSMADFRKTTHEFRKTWEQEASYIDDKTKQILSDTVPQNPVAAEGFGKDLTAAKNKIASPQIKQINQEDFAKNFPQDIQPKTEPKIETTVTNKQDWI